MTADSQGLGRLLLVVALLIACPLFFLHPLGFLLLICIVAIVAPTQQMSWLFLVSVCSLFTVLNLSRTIDGDLITYVQLQDYISQKSLLVLLQKDELQLISGTYRVTEVGYYAPLWFMSLLLTDSKSTIAVAATLGIYVPTFVALTVFARNEKWGTGQLLIVALFAFFAGINFLESLHLVRQYISSSMLFLAMALFLSGRWRWALLACLYACTVHNGTALLIPVVASACWLFRRRENFKYTFLGVLLRLLLLLLVLGGTAVAVPLLTGERLAQDVPNIKPIHFIMTGVLFLVAHVSIESAKLRLSSIYYARVAFLAIFVLSFVFFLLQLPLYSLRYFVYLEWLYGLMVGAILLAWFRRSLPLQLAARVAVALAASAILIGRVYVSEWEYGPGDNNFVRWGFFEVAQLISR